MKSTTSFILSVLCALFLSYMFFCISSSYTNGLSDRSNKSIYELTKKVDSLENIINNTFKNKKDTIVVQTYPQTIKVYCNSK